MHEHLEDKHGREVSYMRISVTDRCNLRCTYCAGEGLEFIPHPRILRYEEIMDLIGMARNLGVQKIRFTGGEPFVRKGFADFMIRTAERFTDMDLCVTTNATLIGPDVDRLAAAGIKRVNISLDTLRADKFVTITGRDHFTVVRENIDRCLAANMTVKVNAVAMKGVNDDELGDFIEFARTHPLDFRFIEFMPVGTETGWDDSRVWTAAEILADARAFAELIPVVKSGERRHGPARMYEIAGGLGRIGLISPYSDHFCSTCNRLRITSDGNLRTCLFSDRVYRLRPALRHPRLGLDQVEKIIRLAGKNKPIGNELLRRMRASDHGVCKTRMASIGG